MMGIVVISSNFLVQFPVKIFGLEELLTYGAFSYPVTFLITDLANRAYGKGEARKIVYIGFILSYSASNTFTLPSNIISSCFFNHRIDS